MNAWLTAMTSPALVINVLKIDRYNWARRMVLSEGGRSGGKMVNWIRVKKSHCLCQCRVPVQNVAQLQALRITRPSSWLWPGGSLCFVCGQLRFLRPSSISSQISFRIGRTKCRFWMVPDREICILRFYFATAVILKPRMVWLQFVLTGLSTAVRLG